MSAADHADGGRARRGAATSRRLPRWSALAAWGGAAVLAALAAHTVLVTLLTVARTHGAIPQADEWFSLQLYDRFLQELEGGRVGTALRLLFEPHNEHRLVFPRLVFFADYRVFGGSGVFDKAVILATQASHAALFAWLAARAGAGAAARVALGAVAVVLLFSLQQGENFVWAFQVQFVGVFACASLCCTLFAFGLRSGAAAGRGGGRPRDPAVFRFVVGAFALVLVATFTMANGLLVGPVLVALALLARAGRAAVLAAAAVTVAAVAAFFAGYHPDTDRESAADLLVHLPRVVAFAAGYLGTFSRFGQASQIALGACGLAATAAVAGILAFRGDALRSGRGAAQLALLGIALFAAGSALVTSVGRSGSGLEFIGSSRYATGAACFWAATIANLWTLDRGGLSRRVGRLAAGLAAAVLLEASAAGQGDRGVEMDRRAAQYAAMEDAMLLGLYDAPALRSFEEPVDQARAMEPVLRRRHLSIFATRDAGLLGRPSSDAAAPGAPPLACAGGFASAVAEPALGPDGVAVAGTSGLRSRSGRPGRVYVADGADRIVGFAHTGLGDGRWSGYARARPGAVLAAWALSDAGRLCRLGEVSVGAAPGG